MCASDDEFRLGATQLRLKLTNQPVLGLALHQCLAFLLALAQVGESSIGRPLIRVAVVPHVLKEPLRVGVSRRCPRSRNSPGVAVT
jgi:hypothetical protein